MLRRKILGSSLIAAVVSITGCSTIMSSDKQEIEFKTKPENVSLVITDENEVVVFKGITPCKFELQKTEGYFRPKNYQVHIEKGGYQAVDIVLEAKNNGWYVFGNTLNLFIPGWGAVDPKAGTQYVFTPGYVELELTPLAQQIVPIEAAKKIEQSKKTKSVKNAASKKKE